MTIPLLFPTGLKPAALFLAEAILFPRLATDRKMVVNNLNQQNPGIDRKDSLNTRFNYRDIE